jgi:hypothetical protein
MEKNRGQRAQRMLEKIADGDELLVWLMATMTTGHGNRLIYTFDPILRTLQFISAASWRG